MLTDLKMYLKSFLTTLALATLARAVVGPGTVTGNTAVHDPTMCKDNTGKYFVFCKFAIRPDSWVSLLS